MNLNDCQTEMATKCADAWKLAQEQIKTQWKLFCHYGNQFFYKNSGIFEKITQKNGTKHTQVIKVKLSFNNLDSKIQVIIIRKGILMHQTQH